MSSINITRIAKHTSSVEISIVKESQLLPSEYLRPLVPLSENDRIRETCEPFLRDCYAMRTGERMGEVRK